MIINRQPPALFDILGEQPATNLLAQNPVAPPEAQQLMQSWGHFPTVYGNAALYLQTHNPRLRD